MAHCQVIEAAKGEFEFNDKEDKEVYACDKYEYHEGRADAMEKEIQVLMNIIQLVNHRLLEDWRACLRA